MEANMMYPKMEKIGDMFKLLGCGNPKRITFDLSEDGEFYNVKIYIDIVDKSKDEEYEGYITCKSSLNTVASYPLIYDHIDRDAEIFTITIPDMGE
jgi:hypothetical protein